jgi:hypothetical protein
MELLRCVQIDDSKNETVLSVNPAITCWEKEHLRYVYYITIPSLIVWGIGTPLFFLLILWLNRDNIKRNISIIRTVHEVVVSGLFKRRTRSRVVTKSKTDFEVHHSTFSGALNFLYCGYTEDYLYWEICLFARKFSLTFITVFTEFMNDYTKSGILIVYIFFWLEIQLKTKPYISKVLNTLEEMGLSLALIIINMGIIMWFYEEWSLPLAVLIVALNCLYLFNFIFAISIYFYEKKTVLTKKMDKVFGKRAIQRSRLRGIFTSSKKFLFIAI